MSEPCRHIELLEMQQALAGIFDSQHPNPRRVIRLERESSAYHSSFPLEELTIWFENGELLKLIFKNLNPLALSMEARRAKPLFLDDPLREIELYRSVLDAGELGTPICYGSIADLDTGRYWLFLEKVASRELYQVGDFEIWRQAARWLAKLHSRYTQPDFLPPTARKRLIQYDAPYYELWLARALSFGNQALLRQLADDYPRRVSELTLLPRTLIHGEFYPSNILAQDSAAVPRICAIDWERAAWAPGLIDVAALTAGKWSEQEKTELALEYYAALRSFREVPPQNTFLRNWHLCRLHLAVQWLGWSSDWSPPIEHRQDWLAEALDSANRLRD